MRNPFRKKPLTSWVTLNDSAKAWQDALDDGHSPYVLNESSGEIMEAVEVRATADGLAEVRFVRGIGYTERWWRRTRNRLARLF